MFFQRRCNDLECMYIHVTYLHVHLQVSAFQLASPASFAHVNRHLEMLSPGWYHSKVWAHIHIRTCAELPAAWGAYWGSVDLFLYIDTVLRLLSMCVCVCVCICKYVLRPQGRIISAFECAMHKHIRVYISYISLFILLLCRIVMFT